MRDLGLMPVLLAVLKNKTVIIAAIVCFVLMDFANFVHHYRKKPAAPKIRKAAAEAAPAAEASGGDGDGDDGADEE